MQKILVIEDEFEIRENITELLHAQNFQVIAVENGIKGVTAAQTHIPDLIICDISMPELDGYRVLEALRHEPITASIPFIFLTAFVEKSNTRKGMELGADDYLTKPCTPGELLSAIAARLAKQATRDRQQSEKLEELRQSIILSLPHELRTPLNGILASSELLLMHFDQPEDADTREMIELINISGKRLYRLIQNFLLYAELELIAASPEQIKALQAHSTPCAEALVTEKAVYQAQQVHRQPDLELELEDAYLQISPTRLMKIVDELVDNAFKFSVPGTPVKVACQVSQGIFTLSVSDKGRGMKPEQLMQIGAHMQFDRKLYEQQGSGLGLAIAKRLAELHGGSLSIESVPAEQTTVTVKLPLAPE
ncbi:response regulator [Oscillatoria amoena NRMC-F 0135]|nr:response regulator [Oscillatoria amoena NRMC-F 0135]